MIALRRVTTLPFCHCKLVKSASNPEIFVFFSEREAEGLKIRGKWPWIFDTGKIQRKHATYPEAYDSHFNVRFPKCNITIGIWLPFLDSKPLVLIIEAYTFVFTSREAARSTVTVGYFATIYFLVILKTLFCLIRLEWHMFGCFQLFATNSIILYYLSGAFAPGNQIHTVIQMI